MAFSQLSLFFLIFLMVHRCKFCVADYPLKTTLDWNLTSFELPDRGNVVLALKTTENTPVVTNISLFVQANKLRTWECTFEVHSWPFFRLGEKEVHICPHKYDEFHIPDDWEKTKRTILVSSKGPMSWQLFSLPLEENEIKVTWSGISTEFLLPHNSSYITFRQPDSLNSSFKLQFYIGETVVAEKNFTENAEDKWSIFAIGWWSDKRHLLVYHEKDSYSLPYLPSAGKKELRGAQGIRVTSENLIQSQVFSLPIIRDKNKSLMPVPSPECSWKTVDFISLTVNIFLFLYFLTTLPLGLYIFCHRKKRENNKGQTFPFAGGNGNRWQGSSPSVQEQNTDVIEEAIYEEIDDIQFQIHTLQRNLPTFPGKNLSNNHDLESDNYLMPTPTFDRKNLSKNHDLDSDNYLKPTPTFAGKKLPYKNDLEIDSDNYLMLI